MFRYVLSAVILISFMAAVPGCGSPRSERPKPKANSIAQWEEGKALIENETVSILMTSIAAKSWKEVGEIAKDPALKTAMESFEAAELPEDLESKKIAKVDLVQKFKILIEDANAGSKSKISADGTELKNSYERFLKSE